MYESMINDMLKDHVAESQMRSSLVVINSFDGSKEDIEEVLEKHRVYSDVFEIDRLNAIDREEYLLCFNKMYSTRLLPLIFVKNRFVGGGFEALDSLERHFKEKKGFE